MNDFDVEPHWWHSTVKFLGSKKLFANIFALIAHRVDGMVYRISDGEHTAVNLLTGLPVIQLTTTGAKSGKRRTVPLIGIPQGKNIILIASNWGGSRHPGWYYNLLANPEVVVTFDGRQEVYSARSTSGDERAFNWQMAVDNYGGYQAYERRLKNREIPVVILEQNG